MSSSSVRAKGGRWSRKQSLSVCITGPGQAAAEINPEIKLNGKEEETTDIHHISPPAEQNQIPGSVSSGSFSEGYTGEGAGSDTRMWYLGVRECPKKKYGWFMPEVLTEDIRVLPLNFSTVVKCPLCLSGWTACKTTGERTLICCLGEGREGRLNQGWIFAPFKIPDFD